MSRSHTEYSGHCLIEAVQYTEQFKLEEDLAIAPKCCPFFIPKPPFPPQSHKVSLYQQPFQSVMLTALVGAILFNQPSQRRLFSQNGLPFGQMDNQWTRQTERKSKR